MKVILAFFRAVEAHKSQFGRISYFHGQKCDFVHLFLSDALSGTKLVFYTVFLR
jgi:hypothetical protein